MNNPLLAIDVADLRFSYHEYQAIRGVSFSVPAGERLGLAGPNGAGKSTLLLHLNGLLEGQGSITIDGKVVGKKTLSDIRKTVGLVFADAEDQLFMPTLEQDVAFGPMNMGLSVEDAKEKTEAALSKMNLKSLKNRSSHHLSDGERRRAAIATVLSMEPAIWVLDEPAANLDPRSRRELIEILKKLPGTVVLASHDLDLMVQVCKRCLVLDEGRLIADGPADEILSDEVLMEAHGLEVPYRLKADGAF